MNISYVSEILSHLDCKLAFYDAELDIGKMTEGVPISKYPFTDWGDPELKTSEQNVF